MGSRHAFYVGLLLIVLAIFAQSYNGRRDVVVSQQQQCLAFNKHVLVPLLNLLRADQQGDAEIAKDPTVNAATRRSRARESRAEIVDLMVMDAQVDFRVARGLNAHGRRIVARYRKQHRAFDCRKVYPAASPLQFFN